MSKASEFETELRKRPELKHRDVSWARVGDDGHLILETRFFDPRAALILADWITETFGDE